MKLSIVTTMYRSEAFIEDFCRRVSLEAQAFAGDDYELVIVDDGSPDDSLAVGRTLQQTDPHIRIVELARNFGHHQAIFAGLQHARGDFVLLMDCDLEEQPEWLALFAATMSENGADVVFGVQAERAGDGASKHMGGFFWRAINWFSSVRIPTNPMTCRLMKRDYVDALLRVEDHVLFLAGTFAWTGFIQHAIPLTKISRPRGHSSYNLPRKMLQVADSFSSFSVAPLIWIFLFGVAVWFGSLVYGGYVIFQRLFNAEDIQTGFATLAASIWFLGGSIILFLGVIGLYVSKLFQEVKRRPLYIVRNVYQGSDHGK